MTQAAMLSEIDKALGILRRERSRAPSDLALSNSEKMVRLLRERVASEWPLSNAVAGRLVIAQHATRNLDPDFPDLVVQLVRIERLAQEGGAGEVIQPPQG